MSFTFSHIMSSHSVNHISQIQVLKLDNPATSLTEENGQIRQVIEIDRLTYPCDFKTEQILHANTGH